jgi:hypothetical protein
MNEGNDKLPHDKFVEIDHESSSSRLQQGAIKYEANLNDIRGKVVGPRTAPRLAEQLDPCLPTSWF